jgi:TPR repeat protein
MTTIEPPKQVYKKWYKDNVARAKKGDVRAMLSCARLAHNVFTKDRFHQTPREKQKVSEMEMYWYEKGAKAGDKECMYRLGKKLLPEIAVALPFFEKAAELGHPDAQEYLAYFYGDDNPTLSKKYWEMLSKNDTPLDEVLTASHKGRQERAKQILNSYLQKI